MADTIQEVLPFLDDEKSNVRTEALKILAHLVNESNADLFYERSVFAKIMQCLSTVDSSEVVVQAAILLINLIAENPSVPEDAGLVEKLMEVLQQNTLDEHTNTFLMLLANATVSESACHILFRNCSDYLQPFMEKYLEYNPQLEDDSVQDFATVDRWQYFSNVLCNICRLEEGRRVILNKSSNNMTRLLRQFRSRNTVRSLGAVGSVRSCLFDADFHWWLVNELDITTHLLLPLVVATPLTDTEKVGMNPLLWMQGDDKKAVSDPQLQKLLVECILLLCQQRIIRERLRALKVYPIIRNFDYEHDNQEASDVIYEIVQLLVRDEAPEEADITEIADNEIADNTVGPSNLVPRVEECPETDLGDDGESALDGVD